MLSDIFTVIIDGTFHFVSYIINILLTPINAAINLALQGFGLGGLDACADLVDQFFDNLQPYVNWVLSYTGWNNTVFQNCRILLYAIVFIPLTIYGVKIAVNWFKTFKVG